MATRRGPKVEPHDNPRVEKFEIEVNDLQELPKAQIFEEPQEKLMTEEQVVAQEEFIFEEPETIAEEETIEAEPPVEPKEVHFEFQDEYHFGPGNGDAIIDTLPQPKRKKRMDELNQTELRMFHKTGFMPEI
jgi:hypothetical protein